MILHGITSNVTTFTTNVPPKWKCNSIKVKVVSMAATTAFSADNLDISIAPRKQWGNGVRSTVLMKPRYRGMRGITAGGTSAILRQATRSSDSTHRNGKSASVVTMTMNMQIRFPLRNSILLVLLT